MIEMIPSWVDAVFVVTVCLAIFLFHLANGKPRYLTALIIVWSVVQAVIAYTGFYQIVVTVPPRFALVLLPVLLLFVFAFRRKQIAWMIENRNTDISTFLHTIRIPVEIVLLYLFLDRMVPQIMTFEGANFDILAGLSAPIVGYLFLKKKLSKRILLIWNFLGLTLICTIFLLAILSSELPVQQFAFEQPNRAVTYFPYVLLPATVVPIVVYTHLTDIIKLRKELKSELADGNKVLGPLSTSGLD